MNEIQWQYKAETSAGLIVQGQLLAASRQDVLAFLSSEGLIPLTLKKQSARAPGDIVLFGDQNKLSSTDFAEITRGLSDLISAGVPLADALTLLERRHKKQARKKFLNRQLRQIRSGKTLSQSLATECFAVPKLMTALIAAGEASSTLDQQLASIADTLEQQVKFKREMIGQLIYPCALLCLVILTIVFLSFFVLPQFETIFLNADTTPPLETKIVLNLGAWIRQYGFLAPALFGSLFLIGLFLRQRYHYALSRWALSVPFAGKMLLKQEAGNYARSLGALLSGGTALSDALPIASKAISSPFLKDQFDQASKQIRAGSPLAKSLQDYELTPNEVISLAEIGETTGELGPMLTKAADLCEHDIKSFLSKLMTLSGPLLTALMGLVTAAVIASVMSGVLSLNDAIY